MRIFSSCLVINVSRYLVFEANSILYLNIISSVTYKTDEGPELVKAYNHVYPDGYQGHEEVWNWYKTEK